MYALTFFVHVHFDVCVHVCECACILVCVQMCLYVHICICIWGACVSLCVFCVCPCMDVCVYSLTDVKRNPGWHELGRISEGNNVAGIREVNF